MPDAATFDSFAKELSRLVDSFGQRLAELKQPGYSEAQLRDDFLNPFFRALGWDMENRAGFIQKEREVEIESTTRVGGRRKRADYLFRAGKRDRFVCEAKKPAESLQARYAFQAKRDAWNKGVPVAILTDFEELKLYVVGDMPRLDEPDVGEWRSWHFRQYPLVARELWDLLARDRVAAGSIDAMLDALPKKPSAKGRGKGHQQWIVKPDRTRALDAKFLEFLDQTRRDLASDIYKNNDHDELLDGNRLTEAVQRIIDRILFLRICEDRDIDTGTTMQSIVGVWRKNPGNEDVGRRASQQSLDRLRDVPPENYGADGIRAPKNSLWHAVTRHFRALDRRPPTHVPFFNGNLFKPHFIESLVIGDEWLAGFIGELSDDESPYLFSEIPVEILGSVYERFLGKVVRPHGKGITVEEKPEVRKAGGVYYTPRYIVDYIIEQTCGRLLDEIAHPGGGRREENTASTGGTTQGPVTLSPSLKDFEKRTAMLRFLDPACGSGSFLIRAFERVCEHWQRWLTSDLRSCAGNKVAGLQSKESSQGLTLSPAAREWQKKHRQLCWLDESTGDVHLTVELKRQILTQNIHGVDLDAAAVEVTQLSLYLKMLEGENRTTLRRQRELLADENEIALLPPLHDNIKCGNSLIASDFSMIPEDLVRVNAFDWPVQFASIMKAGGFDAIVGNPPYILLQNDFRDDDQLNYFRTNFQSASYKLDTYHLFIEQGIKLARPDGRLSFITPSNFLTNNHLDELRRVILMRTQPEELVVVEGGVFAGASVDNAVFVLRAGRPASIPFPLTRAIAEEERFKPSGQEQVHPERVLSEARALFTSGIINPTSQLWDKLSARFARLGTIADVNFGKQLRDRSKFPNDVIEVSSRKMIPQTHVPCVTGKDIERYALEWSNLACLNDTVAQSGGCWDESKHNARCKLLTRQIGRHPTFALDTSGYHCLNTLFMVTLLDPSKISPNFLLGVLNSRLLRKLWTGRFYDQRQTFPKIKGTYLKEMPIILPDFSNPADKSRHDKLVALVEKILALTSRLHTATLDSEKTVLQNAVAATDQQINALVYALYGLTDDEIKLVEGGEK
jgi:hypothetical protein